MSRLHIRGRLPRRGVAIVGSREPPPEAAAFAYRFAYALGEPVVAGLSPGIDTAAHRGALDAGVPTVAFIGYGFGAPESNEQRELEEAIVRAGGAVASLLRPGTPACEESLLARDRLQAEHSRAVILVCSEIDGGAMHTMRFARELGRRRCAVMPPAHALDAPRWAGNLACIADGASPLPFDIDEAVAGFSNGLYSPNE